MTSLPVIRPAESQASFCGLALDTPREVKVHTLYACVFLCTLFTYAHTVQWKQQGLVFDFLFLCLKSHRLIGQLDEGFVRLVLKHQVLHEDLL